MTGHCGKCGGDLDAGALEVTLDAGPGARGAAAWSTVVTRATIELCGQCVGSLAWLITRAEPVPDRVKNRCVVECRGHRQGLLHMVSGAASESARCPNCHRRAMVQVDEGMIVPRLSWRQRLMVRALRRSLTGEKWPAA